MRSRGSHLTLAVIAASMLQSDIRGAPHERDGYSSRNAIIGSSRAARRAGR